jgi:hypothetical protein
MDSHSTGEHTGHSKLSEIPITFLTPIIFGRVFETLHITKKPGFKTLSFRGWGYGSGIKLLTMM